MRCAIFVVGEDDPFGQLDHKLTTADFPIVPIVGDVVKLRGEERLVVVERRFDEYSPGAFQTILFLKEPE